MSQSPSDPAGPRPDGTQPEEPHSPQPPGAQPSAAPSWDPNHRPESPAQQPWGTPPPGQQPWGTPPPGQQPWGTPPAGQQPWGAQPPPQQPWDAPQQQAWPQAGLPQAPGWQDWAGQPYGAVRFDPADPLVSQDYAGWWRRSVAVIRAGWRQLALLQLFVLIPTLAVLIPTQIAYETQQRAAEASLATTGDELPDFGALFAPMATLFAGSIIASVLTGLGILATIHLVVVIATGGRPQVGAAFAAAVRRFFPMVGWYLLAGLIAFAAILACVLPVFYVGAVFVILPAVVMFERGGAIARCFRLFHADLGTSVARVATLFGLAVAGSLVLGALTFALGLGAAIGATETAPGSLAVVGVVSAVLNGLYYFLSGVLGTPLVVTAYADMRARHEPFTSAALVTDQAR